VVTQEFLLEQMVPVVTGMMVLGFDALHKLAAGAIAGPILFFFLCLYLIVLAFSERLRLESYRLLLYVCSCGGTRRHEAVQPQDPSKEQAIEPRAHPEPPSGASSPRFTPPPAPLLELPAGRFARAQARKTTNGEFDTSTPQERSSRCDSTIVQSMGKDQVS
jgi:hypothetical protein